MLGSVGEAFGSVESSSSNFIGGPLGGYFASLKTTGGGTAGVGNMNFGVAFGE